MKKIIKKPVVEIKRSLIEIPRKRDFRRCGQEAEKRQKAKKQKLNEKAKGKRQKAKDKRQKAEAQTLITRIAPIQKAHQKGRSDLAQSRRGAKKKQKIKNSKSKIKSQEIISLLKVVELAKTRQES
jgi:hypothetical protein